MSWGDLHAIDSSARTKLVVARTYVVLCTEKFEARTEPLESGRNAVARETSTTPAGRY